MELLRAQNKLKRIESSTQSLEKNKSGLWAVGLLVLVRMNCVFELPCEYPASAIFLHPSLRNGRDKRRGIQFCCHFAPAKEHWDTDNGCACWTVFGPLCKRVVFWPPEQPNEAGPAAFIIH